MKIVTIVGARPQFIKAAAVSRVLPRRGIQEVLVHTGQHYDSDMSDIFFEQMEIPAPAYHLSVGGGSHGAMTGQQLERVEKVLMAEQPDWVLVYGDTNSTLAGSLAAVKLHIPVAHVEAGLRSFNRRMPEEINRILTDHISELLFAPTETAVKNLSVEGLEGECVRLVGDVMLDATMFYRSKALKPEWFDSLGVARGDFVLCTIHRAENTDDAQRLDGIMRGLGAAAMPVVLPLHPRTLRALAAAEIAIPSTVFAVPPIGYLEMIWLETYCRAIATDSGGIQKEAYFHGKPCVTLREETEWVELVKIGANVLVGWDSERIAAALRQTPPGLTARPDLFGGGNAAALIAEAMVGR